MVGDLQVHRTQAPLGAPEIRRFDETFSSFDFVEREFGGEASIHRAFSLARSRRECRTFVRERIGICGLIESENQELARRGFYSSPDVYRLSFWMEDLESSESLEKALTKNLLGYLIVKRDGATEARSRWHVFESVFQKYNHHHNCVSDPAVYSVGVGGRVFAISGVMYCQQNGLTNACAHVALRSLLSRVLPEGDVPYAEINRICAPHADGGALAYDPAKGLSAAQIKAVLGHFGVTCRDLDYTAGEDVPGTSSMRECLPYQKLVYSGVESGYGALVGFNMPDPEEPGRLCRHLIPFFGHTFNKDTWVSDAEACYFRFGGRGYIPSESWTSSFIGHDDNFGGNFCVPRLYIKPSQVDYVVELMRPGVRYNGVQAELAAFSILPEIVKFLDRTNVWQQRLDRALKSQVSRVILRAVCVSPERYFRHLEGLVDWQGNSERKDLVRGLSSVALPKFMWMVEISLPQLFPANERKLGEIILDATTVFDMNRKVPALSAFLFARLPGSYFVQNIEGGNDVRFFRWESDIHAHVKVLCGLYEIVR